MTDTLNRYRSLARSVFTSISAKTIPLALAGVLLIAFGLVISTLGFYQDDWHHLYFGHSLGLARLWDMFLYDGRPFAAYLYIAGFKILGYQPLHWQISTLLIRFLTVLFAWLLFKSLWPALQTRYGLGRAAFRSISPL